MRVLDIHALFVSLLHDVGWRDKQLIFFFFFHSSGYISSRFEMKNYGETYRERLDSGNVSKFYAGWMWSRIKRFNVRSVAFKFVLNSIFQWGTNCVSVGDRNIKYFIFRNESEITTTHKIYRNFIRNRNSLRWYWIVAEIMARRNHVNAILGGSFTSLSWNMMTSSNETDTRIKYGFEFGSNIKVTIFLFDDYFA